MLDRLPEELCMQVALCLDAQDVLTLLILHRSLTPLGNNARFWKSLLERDSSSVLTEEHATTALEEKRNYMVYARTQQLPQVRWRPVCQTSSPSPREGHLMCVLGSRVILTGGFCGDSRVHVLSEDNQRWTSLGLRAGIQSSFVYGASLTSLDETRAIRFGGFRAGGYTGETNQVCVLHVRDIVAEWENIITSGEPPVARAYHTATLIQGRYLVIIGGMATNGSILQEAILDTLTWTWHDKAVANATTSGKPLGRHGHSVVHDEKRSRLVLFGGGSGSDLLRSGVDNTEVWELKMMNDKQDLTSSLRWTWNKIYKDTNEHDSGEVSSEGKASGLSPAECLVLGRCHVGVKVSRDMVLLAFGSSHPTTNGVLAYNLATDKFHRPAIRGPLPVPRFTAAACVLNDGWLLIHGGYTTQVDGTRGDTVLLDLAPGISRDFSSLRIIPDNDRQVLTYRPIVDRDAINARQRDHDNDIGAMLMELSGTPREYRRELANRMLANVIQRGGMGGRAGLILGMVANGQADLGDED